MHDGEGVRVKFRTGKAASIWLALSAALALHIIVILLPVNKTPDGSKPSSAHIEIELTVYNEPPEMPSTESEPRPVPEEITPEPVSPPETEPEPVERVVDLAPVPEPVPEPVESQPARLIPASTDKSPGAMSERELSRLTTAILTRQYISEKSVTEELFGRPVVQDANVTREGFHYPVRQSMITMLEKPLPDLPFAYTPGLVHFAYDPGVKGDLQRFWDVITPEWGFRTKYGTEVRCVWVLIFAGCAWK